MLSVYTTIKNKIEQKASISIILYSSKSSTCHREMDGNSLASMNVDGVMRAHRMYVYLCTSLSLWMYVCVCTERSTEWTSEWVSLRTLHWTIDKTSNKYIKTEYYWCKPNLTFFPIQIMPYESSAYCKQKGSKKIRLENPEFSIHALEIWTFLFIYSNRLLTIMDCHKQRIQYNEHQTCYFLSFSVFMDLPCMLHSAEKWSQRRREWRRDIIKNETQQWQRKEHCILR